jgi:hypothetical protein
VNLYLLDRIGARRLDLNVMTELGILRMHLGDSHYPNLPGLVVFLRSALCAVPALYLVGRLTPESVISYLLLRAQLFVSLAVLAAQAVISADGYCQSDHGYHGQQKGRRSDKDSCDCQAHARESLIYR